MARHRNRRPEVSSGAGAETNPPEAPVWLPTVILAITALLLLGWFSPASSDSDTWWTLKTGQYIAQHHKLPVPDPFSFTTYAGGLSPNEAVMTDYTLKHEWLAELLLYGIYAAAGFPGLVLF